MELDAREAWNAGADAYVAFVESGADYYRHLVHGPALVAACGNVRGVAALDLGCGHGYFSRLLAKAGAAVTGVDLSDNLLSAAMAREAAEPLGIAYLRADAAGLSGRFADGSFDLVAACMSLQDMADPAGALAVAARVLRPEGKVVFSVPHPATEPPVRRWLRDAEGRKLGLCLDRYFDGGPAVCHWNMARLAYPWRTPYCRRTLAEWSGLVSEAGLAIRRLHEPRPDAGLVATRPELDDCHRMPYFLIFELLRLTDRGHE